MPTFSGLQQLNAQAPVLGEAIPRHYVCGIDHNALATNVDLFAGIAGFLRDGSDITLARASSNGEHDQRGFCGRASTGGRQIIVYGDGTRGPGLPAIDVDPDAEGSSSAAARASQAGSDPMQLHEAARAGLVDVLERGERTVLVARADRPVVLHVSGRKLALQLTPLLGERKGRTVSYEARRGRLVLSGTSATLNGRRLRASARDRTPPRTTVTLRRRDAPPCSRRTPEIAPASAPPSSRSAAASAARGGSPSAFPPAG